MQISKFSTPFQLSLVLFFFWFQMFSPELQYIQPLSNEIKSYFTNVRFSEKFRDTYKFSNEKSGSDQWFYIYNNNIKIFTCSYKTLSKKTNKKSIRLFNEKNTFICWTGLKTEKLLATAKQLIKKNSVYCLKN